MSEIPVVALQDDGSFVVLDEKGSIADFVKKGTPRQSVQIGSQSCNISYGNNSAGKKTILLSVPATSPSVVFYLEDFQVTMPANSALRITLEADNRIQKVDGNPADSVLFGPRPNPATAFSPSPVERAPATPPTQEFLPASGTVSEPSSLQTVTNPVATDTTSTDSSWPGKLLEAPIPASQMEEEMFYARTEMGVRLMSSLSLVSVTGPSAGLNNYTQKQFAFGTGFRQDFDVGVQLIDWFGISLESGYALNSIRANTEGMTISDGTFWTFPFMAQLCFQYPNESGWIPYLNFGFGGAVTLLKLGQVTFTGSPSISGTGNCVTNAYQLSLGVRYRLYEDLSVTLGYKFFGNSQGTVNLNNGVQLGLGSPVTNSAEVGVNLAF